MVNRYIKKPVEIEAIQWNGENALEILKFCSEAYIDKDNYTLKIDTLEGTHTANRGDYIIKGVKGEFYPCKPDIFEMTYDLKDKSFEIIDENTGEKFAWLTPNPKKINREM